MQGKKYRNNKCPTVSIAEHSPSLRQFAQMSVVTLSTDSSHGKTPQNHEVNSPAFTEADTRSMSRFPPYHAPSFAIRQKSCDCNISPFQYQTHGSLLLVSPALHGPCALRIHDAKVRSANGFNGAPTIEISLPARC